MLDSTSGAPTQYAIVFVGFSSRDFDAFVPSKWKSNLFTRERLEVKQKLIALGKLVGGALVGGDGSPLASESSVEYPALWNHKQVEAQHLFFFRNEGAQRELEAILDRQKPLAELVSDPAHHKSHPFLALTLTHEALLISLEMYPDADVDRRSLVRKCEDYFERERLGALLGALPADYRVALCPPGNGSATATAGAQASTLGEAELVKLLEQVHASKDRLRISRIFSRNDDRLTKSEFVDIARDSLASLLPLYCFVTWTRDNDFLSMRETLRQEQQAKRQKHLAKNDRVRIVRGMFSGKIGHVQELDAKGNLRILVGKLVIKVDADDVVRM